MSSAGAWSRPANNRTTAALTRPGQSPPIASAMANKGLEISRCRFLNYGGDWGRALASTPKCCFAHSPAREFNWAACGSMMYSSISATESPGARRVMS